MADEKSRIRKNRITMTTEEAGLHPWRWWLHAFTISYFTMSFVVRFAWPPVIPLAASEFSMEMAGAGSYMSAFFIGYILTQIPGGLLGDRFGTRFVFCTALLIEGVGTLCFSMSHSYPAGFAFRVFTGLGGGMVFASCVRYITVLFPGKELGLAFGLLLMAPSGVGVVISNLLMPWLLGMFDWRGAFRAISLLSFFMAALAVVLVRDTPVRQSPADFIKNSLAVLRRKEFLILGLSGFWLIFTTVGFVNWGNTYFKRIGFDLVEAGQIMVAFGLGGVVGSPLGGWVANRVRSLKKTMISGFLCIAPAIVLFCISSGFMALAASAALIGLLIGFVNPFTTMLIRSFATENTMGTAGGVTSCIYQFGAILAPVLMGYSVDLSGSFIAAWAILGCAPLLGALFMLPLPEYSGQQFLKPPLSRVGKF